MTRDFADQIVRAAFRAANRAYGYRNAGDAPRAEAARTASVALTNAAGALRALLELESTT